MTDALSRLNRRRLLQAAAGASCGAVSSSDFAAADEFRPRGNIRHSVVQWCFQDHWKLEQTCQFAQQLGCQSVELVPSSDWATLRKYGLTCAISPCHLFMQGMNNPRYQPMCLERLRKAIDDSALAGVPTVITFTGYAEETGPPLAGGLPDLSQLPRQRRRIEPEEGIRNCVTGYKQIVGYAEKKGVNLSLEMLNTRDDSHPMKGHPGYQGDHVDYCLEIINQVGSARLGLLFDIYHVQIMDGDLVRRVRQCGPAINHVHTAGNPGRGELDEAQEINYAAVMKALVEIGYDGFVGHEFIPTRDPLTGLRQAIRACDV